MKLRWNFWKQPHNQKHISFDASAKQKAILILRQIINIGIIALWVIWKILNDFWLENIYETTTSTHHNFSPPFRAKKILAIFSTKLRENFSANHILKSYKNVIPDLCKNNQFSSKKKLVWENFKIMSIFTWGPSFDPKYP